jgi:hypothetical protein
MPNHKEAFCLMWYACKCGHRERIWNSRDGVTPFGCDFPSCAGGIMDHVEWRSDVASPHHKLANGQRFWRDGTPDEAEAIMRRRIEKSKGGRWEVPPDYIPELIQAARNEDEGEFQKGWPMLDVYSVLDPMPQPQGETHD